MWMYALLVFVPISLAAQYLLHPGPLWIFATSILAIIPLADGIRRGTEQIADRSGSAVGGLLNVSLGNAAELIIGLIILSSGRVNVVKAQITGSIIGNGLLGLGIAILAGSFVREKQVFDRQKTGLLSSMLILVVIALLVPALFDYTERGYLAVPHPEDL